MRDKIRAAIAANDFGADGLGGDLQPNEIDRLTDAVLAALSAPPAGDVREALAKHRWHLTRWGDGRGGFAWRCSCGVMDWGTGAENPERYQRFPTENDAARAAVAHIAADVRPRGTVTDAEVEAAWQSLLSTAYDVTTSDDVRAALEAAQEARS